MTVPFSLCWIRARGAGQDASALVPPALSRVPAARLKPGNSLDILAPAKIRLNGKAPAGAPDRPLPERRVSPDEALRPAWQRNAMSGDADAAVPAQTRRPLSTSFDGPAARVTQGRRRARTHGLSHWTRNKHAACT